VSRVNIFNETSYIQIKAETRYIHYVTHVRVYMRVSVWSTIDIYMYHTLNSNANRTITTHVKVLLDN